jgi:PRTRC genetic system protein E
MFKELAPVLRHRAVLMTITSTEDDQIRVNVVPKKLKDDENKALTTPLTVTGAAEELDAELGQTLVDFVGSHLQLKNTLVQAKADMDAAAKAAQAEARAKTKTPPQKETNGTTASKPSEQPVKPAEPVQPPRRRPRVCSTCRRSLRGKRSSSRRRKTRTISSQRSRMMALRKERSRKTSPTRPESHIPRKSKQQD